MKSFRCCTALQLPDVCEKLGSMSFKPGAAALQQLSEQLRRDVVKWKKIVTEAGIKVR